MSKTILLVDDSPIIRSVMRTALERDGFTVLEASDGVDALRQLGTNSVNAIVSDLAMPRMDGVTFLKSVREIARYKFTPLIVMSTENRGDVKDSLRQLGAQAFIAKPCPPSQLIDALRRLCV
jgi:two-component system chemotaxis response regulator CheY